MIDLLKQFTQQSHEELVSGTGQEVEAARNYLLNDRKLLENSWKCHTIGYCQSNLDLPDPIRLLGSSENAEDRWDVSRRIKGRIIVPIFSEFGEVVAFATRVPTTEPGHPWWNTPYPFKKGNHLFLLDKVRRDVFNKNKVYVVEGYVDALMLYQSGLKNIVALMGTAYTLRKVALTARYCNNVCLCFDTDTNEAGKWAKFISTAILNKYSFCESISTIDQLPMGDDPASFVGRDGIAKFLAMERVFDEEEIEKMCKVVAKGKSSGLLDAR